MAEVQPKVLSMDDVLTIIQTMNEANHKGLIEAIKELKKPNEFEQAKLDKEQLLLKAKQKERLRLGAAQEQQKLMKMLTCGHSRPDGQHTWTGQVLSNGTFVPTCNQCWSQLPKIPCTMTQVSNGVNLNTYKGLNMESLMAWHKKSYNNDCKNPDCISCHPEKLDALKKSLHEQFLKAQQEAQAVMA